MSCDMSRKTTDNLPAKPPATDDTPTIAGLFSTSRLAHALLVYSVLQNGMNVVGVDQYFQQSILGTMIIVSVALTFDRSKTPVIK
jgi:predicted ABC-type sugar transport system permease subunit